VTETLLTPARLASLQDLNLLRTLELLLAADGAVLVVVGFFFLASAGLVVNRSSRTANKLNLIGMV
jgi:hypothetical protein